MARDASPEVVIDRIPVPSPAEFEREYLRPSRPAIFTNVVTTWPAWNSWSRDYFREGWGSHRILAVHTRGKDVQYDTPNGYNFSEIGLAEALDRLEGGGEDGVYVMVPLDRYLDGLLRDVDVPDFCQGRPGFRPRLWVSAQNIGVPLHRDFSENLIAQVRGSKQYVLYPPEEWHQLYAFQRHAPVPSFSPVNGEEPDHVRFPRCADARRVVVTLHAGEMLFLPSRWWHQVRSREPSITINFWWAAGVYGMIIRVAESLGLGASV